jgi:hypothetical protein
MLTTGLLVAANLVLAALVWWQINRPLPVAANREIAVSAGPIAIAGGPASGRAAPVLPPLSIYGAITARPLFNVSRRPIAVARARTADIGVMLSGIVIDRNRQIAHLRTRSDKRIQALGVGDRIANWRIEQIAPDRVILRSGNQVETLFMQERNAGAVTIDRVPGRLPSRTGVYPRTRPIPAPVVRHADKPERPIQ